MDEIPNSPDTTSNLEPRLIPGYGLIHIPTLDEVGGETAVLAAAPGAETGPDLFTASLALCVSWSLVSDHDAAREWMRGAVPRLEDDELMAFNDVILASPAALPHLAAVLVEAWKTVSDEDETLRGSVALEGWTRLAVGGWTVGITLRGALYSRAERASTGAIEPDNFLVRAIGAALDQWPDCELEQALMLLAAFEDIECDVAFELGMASLREAVRASVIAEAVEALGRAHDRFDHACLEGGRPDAFAFATACTAVASFLEGIRVTEKVVVDIDNAAREWFLGYLGETPNWRQPRAETGGAWALLVRDLYMLRDLDETAWFEPEKLLADVGRLYSAHNSSTLLANPHLLPTDNSSPIELHRHAAHDSDLPTHAVPIALGPRLDSALGADAQRRYLLDRWLETVASRVTVENDAPEADQSGVAALRLAQQRIRERTKQGKEVASREDDGLDPDLRGALLDLGDQETYDKVVELAHRTATLPELSALDLQPGARRVVPLDEQLLLAQLLKDLARVMPTEFQIWHQYLVTLLGTLIAVVKDTIDHMQGGSRRYPWHRVDEGKSAHESALADHLAVLIQGITGFNTDVEVPNKAGGKADILINCGTERFVIEVKRITSKSTNEKLTDKYGDQAGQYTLTGPPFAFLAVLDLTHWTTRLPLKSSFWIQPWNVPTTGETRVLTGMRILADVDSPSVSSV